MPGSEAIDAMNLKKGKTILCGPADQQLGAVSFETSCSGKVKDEFNLGLALLHSFEYDEAEKVFAGIIGQEPGCAMAYWARRREISTFVVAARQEEFEKRK